MSEHKPDKRGYCEICCLRFPCEIADLKTELDQAQAESALAARQLTRMLMQRDQAQALNATLRQSAHEWAVRCDELQQAADQARAEVTRLREALEWIAGYNSTEGNLAQEALTEQPAP